MGRWARRGLLAWMKMLTAAIRSSEIFQLSHAKSGSWAGVPSGLSAYTEISYHNAAWLWLLPPEWNGLDRKATSRSCRIWCRHSLNAGQPFRRGALGERSGRGSIDGSSVGFCAGPAGRMRARYGGGDEHAHRVDRFRG